ncbi:hypothetical protein BC829DRAFT_81923 [Chytridium lagenaria]|nr:hypothetical protein BC829DRAFT_81923 [Chytridium lagenaria]
MYKNVFRGSLRDIARSDFYGTFTTEASVIFNGGKSQPPLDGLEPTLEEIETQSRFSLILLGTCGFGLSLVLASVCVLVKKRNSFTVKITSFPFLMISSAGISIEYISVICYLMNFRHVSRLCSVDLWLGWLGYALFIQGYLPKLLRLYMIYNKRSVRENTMHFFKDTLLIPLSSILPFINLVTLALWTFLPGMQSVQVDGFSKDIYYIECHSPHDSAYTTTLLVFNGLHLLCLSVLAFTTRKVPVPFQENSYIFCMLTKLIFVSAIVVLAFMSVNGGGLFMARLRILLTVVTTFVVFFLTIGRVALSTVFEDSNFASLHNEAESIHTAAIGQDATFQFFKERCHATLLVKDSSKMFATWRPCFLVYYFKTRLLAIVDKETNVRILLHLHTV